MSEGLSKEQIAKACQEHHSHNMQPMPSLHERDQQEIDRLTTALQTAQAEVAGLKARLDSKDDGSSVAVSFAALMDVLRPILTGHQIEAVEELVIYHSRRREALEQQVTALREEVVRLGKEIEQLNTKAAERNRQIDALHMVWCDGGCGNGVHRYSGEPVTADLVAFAIWNTLRLERWYINHAGHAAEASIEARVPEWTAAKERILAALRLPIWPTK